MTIVVYFDQHLVLHTPNASQNQLFHVFLQIFAKFRCKMDEKWDKNEHFFAFLPNAGRHKNARQAP